MKKQTFSFSKNFIYDCTTIKDFGWCKSEVWIDSLDKKKKQEIIALLKKALDGKIEFKNKHFIPSREFEGITYTKYTGFKWCDIKKYPGLLYCTANRLIIIGNTFVVEKERTYIDPTFKVACLIEESEAREYIMSRFNKFLNYIKFKENTFNREEWTRFIVVTDDMVGYTFSVYDGSGFIPVKVTHSMIGKPLKECTKLGQTSGITNKQKE